MKIEIQIEFKEHEGVEFVKITSKKGETLHIFDETAIDFLKNDV